MKITRTDNLGELAKKVFLKEAGTEDVINEALVRLLSVIDGIQNKRINPQEINWQVAKDELLAIKQEWDRTKPKEFQYAPKNQMGEELKSTGQYPGELGSGERELL